MAPRAARVAAVAGALGHPVQPDGRFHGADASGHAAYAGVQHHPNAARILRLDLRGCRESFGLFLRARHRPLRSQDRDARAVRLFCGDHGGMRTCSELRDPARRAHGGRRLRRGGRRQYFHHRRGRGPGKPARPGLRRGHVGLLAGLDPGRADQPVPRAAFHLARALRVPRRALFGDPARGLVRHPAGARAPRGGCAAQRARPSSEPCSARPTI